MIDMNENTIRQIDATILLVFLSLMRRRKTTAVADELGLTQSAISHSLKRLRALFDDELFQRRSRGLEPTPFARALEPRIVDVVDGLSAILQGPEPFDPANSTGSIRIAAYDYELAVVMPRLLQQTLSQTPGMSIDAVQLQPTAALAELTDGSVDLAIGILTSVRDEIVADPLYAETYRVVGRAGHPLFQGHMSEESYAKARHLLVAPSGETRGVVDFELARRGLSRNVASSVPFFFPALATLSGSDLVATLPSRIVAAYASPFGLESRPLPLEVGSFTVSALRHRRWRNSPLHSWLIGLIGDIMSDAEPGPR